MTQLKFPGLDETQAGAVQRIVQAALSAADPRAAVRSVFETGAVRPEVYRRAGRLRVIGVGKAAQGMAQGLLDVLGDQLADGLIITKHVQGGLPERIRVMAGDHPVPGAGSAAATRALVEFVSGGQTSDVLFCLISGGGSALMTLPVDGVSLEDLQDLTRRLLASGATIDEMNTLRKHTDQVKGGRLARLASPAQLVTLILSDVIGSPLDVIASGPTVPDSSTYAEGLAILQKYDLLDKVAAPVRAVFEEGAHGAREETPKTGDPRLQNVINHVVSSNLMAAQAAAAQARVEGFNALLLTTYLQGEASQVGQVMAAVLRQIDQTGQPLERPACIIAGGETTVTLRGKGKGGRNQEVALGAVTLLDGLPKVALLALGTDGEDGPTDAAGALVDGDTLTQARTAGLDPAAALRENDAYPFFERLGRLLVTGPTGTNVNDLTFLFAF